MKYPECFRFWIEFETLPGWDSSMPLRSGCSTLEEVAERLEELMGLGEPWASRTFRVVNPAGELLREIEKAKAGRPKIGSVAHTNFRKEASEAAGISKHQRDQALRVANVPKA